MAVEPGNDRGKLSHDPASVRESKLTLVVRPDSKFGKQGAGEEAVPRASIDQGIHGEKWFGFRRRDFYQVSEGSHPGHASMLPLPGSTFYMGKAEENVHGIVL